MKRLAVFFMVILCSWGAYAYSSGPPTSVCGSLRPGSPHGFALQTGNGGYMISVPSSLPRATTGDGFDYQPGQSYTIRLEKNNAAGENFRGFAFQVVQAGTTTLLGTLAGPGTDRRYLSCTGNGMATITHSRAFSRTSEEFTWTAPTGSAGTVDFRYTVVRTMPVYYFALLASSDNYVVQMAPTTSPPNPPMTPDIAKSTMATPKSELVLNIGSNQGRIFNECPSEETREGIFNDVLQLLSSAFNVNPLGLARTYAALSCELVLSVHPGGRGRLYWINDGSTTQQQYCD